MDQGALIELVKQYSHLYDKCHPDFKNKMSKENAWKMIAEIMAYPREEVETIWTSLRNRYVTEKRKMRLVPTGSAPLPIWRYYKQMTFLDDFITIRKTEGNISKNVWSTSIIVSTEDQESSSLDHDDSIMSQHEQSSQIDEEPKAGGSTEPKACGSTEPKACGSKEPRDAHKENIYTMRKHKKRKTEDTNVEKCITTALGALGHVFNMPEENDEDMLFGKSMGQSLAHIDDRKIKARAKIEILEVIEKYSS